VKSASHSSVMTLRAYESVTGCACTNELVVLHCNILACRSLSLESQKNFTWVMPARGQRIKFESAEERSEKLVAAADSFTAVRPPSFV
jgi:hypothetical protein